jgi:small conductance mechanosensitive channel
MNLDQIDIDKAQVIMDAIIAYSAQIVPNIIGAILILWIGFKIVNILNRIVATIMEKNDWDLMLESFISSLIAIILKVIVIISAA